jgi:hypothetical protein
MPTHLKSYTPTEKGKELIAVLFPLSHTEREKSMVDYWKQYATETTALLDGFHFILLEMIDERNTHNSTETFEMPEELLQVIFTNMQKKKNFFSYQSSKEFFNALSGIDPPLFLDPKKVSHILEDSTTKKSSAYVSKFNLPAQFDEIVLKKVTEICKSAEDWYSNALKTMPSIQNAQKMIAKFQNVNDQITLMDVKLSHETLNESRKNFNENASEIAKNWPYIYDVYCFYPGEIIIKQIYMIYLAKLLGTRESRYSIENYILSIGNERFNFEKPDFEPTIEQLQHGKTNVTIQEAYLKGIIFEINRLECRYRKRKLMVKLKEKVPKNEILKELLEISHIDPLDIKTHILLARMFGEYALVIKNHQKRTSMREQALRYCNLAFSKIDDYLNLQNIQILKERDILRAGFIKTISAIRIPLIRKK